MFDYAFWRKCQTAVELWCWNKVNILVCHRRTYLLTFAVGAIIKHGADNTDKSDAGGITTEATTSSEWPYQCRPELVERGNMIKATFTGESSLSVSQTTLCSLSLDWYLSVCVLYCKKKPHKKYTDTSLKVNKQRGLSSYFTFSILSCQCTCCQCCYISARHAWLNIYFTLSNTNTEVNNQMAKVFEVTCGEATCWISIDNSAAFLHVFTQNSAGWH